jgi:hypothetical protein
LRSPSYCIIPTNLVCSRGQRQSASGYSKAVKTVRGSSAAVWNLPLQWRHHICSQQSENKNKKRSYVTTPPPAPADRTHCLLARPPHCQPHQRLGRPSVHVATELDYAHCRLICAPTQLAPHPSISNQQLTPTNPPTCPTRPPTATLHIPGPRCGTRVWPSLSATILRAAQTYTT